MDQLQPLEVEILLPVHNEAETIESTLREIYREVCHDLRVRFIICEDGSKDNSKDVLRRLREEIPMNLILSDDRKGYSRAVRDGMEALEAHYLVCMDSDGQCDPKDFQRFWDLRGTSDVVVGWRRPRADPLLRRALSRFFRFFFRLLYRVPIHDPSCPYILVRKDVVKRLVNQLGAMQQGFWWEFVARLYRMGCSIREVEVHHRVRAGGTTQVYDFRKMPGIFLRHLLALFRIWYETRQ
jgi:glycosyltransferase involved in cell wall biosynthesis